MKVIALNGSPRKNGNTFQSLERLCASLNAEGAETEIIQIGGKGFAGCRACGACAKLGKCAFGDKDGLNEIGEKLSAADGMVIGAPVYYADISGEMKAFLDRLFYSYGQNFRFKPGAAVVALRRGGAIHAYDTINHYFGITEMIQVPSMYWNDVHGAAPGECLEDREAMQLMDVLGKNMAFLIKLLKQSDVAVPERQEKIKTNFI